MGGTSFHIIHKLTFFLRLRLSPITPPELESFRCPALDGWTEGIPGSRAPGARKRPGDEVATRDEETIKELIQENQVLVQPVHETWNEVWCRANGVEYTRDRDLECAPSASHP